MLGSHGNPIFTSMDSGKPTTDTTTSTSTLNPQNIPPIRPTSPSPLSQDITRQSIARQQHNNYHSSSLKTTMVSQSVNKTALYPTGVEYVIAASLSCLPRTKSSALCP